MTTGTHARILEAFRVALAADARFTSAQLTALLEVLGTQREQNPANIIAALELKSTDSVDDSA